MRVHMMVYDTSQDRRYNRAIYRVKSFDNDRALVQRVGDLVHGRLAGVVNTRDETYRDIKNLVEWKD